MAKLVWDQTGERIYETGTKNGVLYVRDENGEISGRRNLERFNRVTQSSGGAEPGLWADDIKSLNIIVGQEFGATIEAYTYPEEFEVCDGSVSLAPGVTIGQQKKERFSGCPTRLVGKRR